MKPRRCVAVSAFALLLASGIASAGVIDTVSAADRRHFDQIDAAEPEVHVQPMAGSAWPAVTVSQLVNTTPEAAMAVFTDYDEQASYLRDCCGVLQSRVIDPAVGGDRRVQRVLYELEVPIVSNERYELREEMSRAANGSYRVVWGKVSSGGHSDAIFGRATFEPRDGRTLFTYYNYTKITAFGAGAFADASVARARTTVSAMARHMEEESASGGGIFQEDLARLRAALGG
jgi:hypothetical protein